MTRIAFAMEQSLGNVTHYLNMRAAEDAAPWMQARWLPIEYRSTRVPWAAGGSVDAFRALIPVLSSVDVAFIHTTTVALLSPALLPRRPLVLSTDGTPNKRGMRRWYNLKEEGPVAGRLKRGLYSTVFQRADGFVSWCEWTKTSLVEDYGVDPARVAVIPPGINLDSFRPTVRDNPLPRILFVGGDFVRKGGDLLLEVFRKRLRGRAELDLVTPADIKPEDGVRVHRGVKANSPVLHQLFAGCDVFVLPTRGEVLPLAGMEALAAGLPLVTTRVGGMPELVRDGETGRLVDVDDAARLGDALEELATNADLRARMSAAARLDATQRFDARTNALRVFDFVRTRARN
jgi:glycosyltransferase involved in cell wall biosynthesis